MDKESFISKVGWVFEHSPWIAEQAWESRPFMNKELLLETMKDVVKNSSLSLQLSLFRAHPDLGTRLKMSDMSMKEQANVGLDQLSKEEYNEFQSLNKIYVEKYGFPFIMAVKGQNKETILSLMKQRVSSTYDKELSTALQEVFKIVDFRINDIIQ
ncbi:2-oxo-4-hydroxy-4-carboxy-5-ureidoimidazoline decarboxylase [Bacillus sp. AK128]